VAARSVGRSESTPLYRAVLEAYLLLVPLLPAATYGVIALAYGLHRQLLGLFVLVVLVDRIPVSILLALDARQRQRAARDWQPGYRYAAAALLTVSIPVAAYYLYTHHRRVGTVGRRQGWWRLLPLSSLGVVWFFSLDIFLLVGTALDLSVEFSAAPFYLAALVGALFVGLAPLAVYRDATYIRSTDSEWNPNPATHYAIAATAISPLVFFHPVYVAYYLRRRRKALD